MADVGRRESAPEQDYKPNKGAGKQSTKTEDEEKLRRYKGRIQAAKKAQEKFLKNAETNLGYYRNLEKVHTKGGQKVRVPKAIQAVDSMFAALTSFDVSMTLAPMGITTRAQAKVAEQALEVEWLRCKVQEKTDDAAKDSLIAGIGYALVDYEYEDETEEVDKSDEELQDEVSAALIEKYGTDSPDVPEEELAAFAQGISDKKDETTVTRDRVVVEYLPHDEVFFDPEAKHWRDLRWVAQRFEIPLEDVEADPDITPAAKAGLKRDSTLNKEWRASSPDKPMPEEERIILWKIWDLPNGTWCVFGENHDKLLKEGVNPYSFHLDLEDRNPIVPLILRTNPGEVVGISDVEAMRPSIDEANINRSNLTTFVDRFKTKVVARQETLTDAGKSALRSQEHGAVVEVTTDVSQIRPLDMPSLPQEAWSQDAKALSDADQSIGLNEILQGMMPVGKKTATAMNQFQAATETRHSEKRNHMERFYRSIGRRMLNLMQVLYEEPRITRMVESEGDVLWEWTGEDLTMEAQIEVVVQPKPVKDHQTRKEDLFTLLNYLGQMTQIINTQALVKYILEELQIPAEVVRTFFKSAEEQQAEAEAAQAAESGGAPGLPEAGAQPAPALPGMMAGAGAPPM